jgi:hypothetical protein
MAKRIVISESYEDHFESRELAVLLTPERKWEPRQIQIQVQSDGQEAYINLSLKESKELSTELSGLIVEWENQKQ